MSRSFSSALGADPASQIKALAIKLKQGNPGSKHSHCLEIISRMLGFRSWNVVSALCKTQPERIELLLNKLEIK